MMSIVSKSILILRKAAALMLLPLLAWSCQLVTDDFDDETANISNATQYINITISVSASESPVTRANEPKGGEDGDGREAAQTAETAVEGVTVIFFQNYGINATDVQANATMIDYVEYFDNMQLDNAHATQHLTGHENEVFYTTGQRELSTLLNIENPYHMLVVANANLTSQITPGTTTLKQVRDMTQANFKNGNNKFIMSSKEDHTINFNNSTYDKSTNRRTFYLDCIHIERLAARIDYWAKGSNGYKTKNKNNGDYTVPGYEYTVVKENGTTDSGDRFVLTRITPFNLNNGNEYLLKRTTTGFTSEGFATNDAPITYLANEVASGTGVNWVLDPNTTLKNTTDNYANYNCKLSDVFTTFEQTGHTITMAGQQANKFDVGTDAVKDNIIVGYAKENTLIPGVSPLYYHATGLAFEGYYYENGIGTGERRVYYHFIRHQGEKETAYDAFTADNINDSKTMYCPATPAMNFGIVRNNIYRISIDKITEDMKIKVKMWDKFEHAPIYM